MATYKDIENSLRDFIILEQSDAHNTRTANNAKYNNLKIWMNPSRIDTPHVFIRISISEAAFSLQDFSKINGGLGYEERLVHKWFSRYGIKEKLVELWNYAEKNKEDM
jgi:hypothetical protein